MVKNVYKIVPLWCIDRNTKGVSQANWQLTYPVPWELLPLKVKPIGTFKKALSHACKKWLLLQRKNLHYSVIFSKKKLFTLTRLEIQCCNLL
jgi:hypothetical protein